jgi:glycerol-3-phosphate acyltransferase PlsY
VRTLGSGNLGATNVYRSLGPAIGIATLLLDIAKGALPVWLVPGAPWTQDFPGGHAWCALAVGFAAVAGHVWTFLAGFKGGKGVATTVGVLLALSPPAFGVFVLVFLAVLLATRYVSLGSILGAIGFVIALWRFNPDGVQSPAFLLGCLLAVVVIVRHKDNIVRLAKGTERRFTFTRGLS